MSFKLPGKLQARIDDLRACVVEAIAAFGRDHLQLRAKYSKRSEASLIHDYMRLEAMKRFPWKVRRNLFLIAPISEYRIKLKRLDSRLRARNNPTQLVFAFNRQATQMPLIDDLNLTNLWLGYQRHPVELGLSKIWIVQPRGNGIAWAIELTDEGGTQSVPVLNPQPLAPTGPRRVRPRRPRQDPDRIRRIQEGE